MSEQSVKFIRVRGRVIPIKPKKQEARGKSVATTSKASVAVGAVSAAVTYGFMRKFKLSKIPALARLQKATQKDGLSINTGLKPGSVAERVQSAIYGIRNKGPGHKGVTLFHGTAVPKGTKGHVINPSELADAFGDKRTFGSIFANVPKATPKTIKLDEALSKVGGDPKKLQNLFPEKKFLLKADESAMQRVSDFLNETDMPLVNPKKLASKAKAFVAQERLDLKGEYRAHYLNGKVYGISHRYLKPGIVQSVWNTGTNMIGAGKGGGAFVPVMNPIKRKQIREYLTKNMDAVGGKNLGKNNQSLHAAFDIGDIGGKDGLRMIEANPTMGTFMNPINNRQFTRYATGRWGKDVSAASGALAGAGAYKLSDQANQRKKK